MTTTKFIVFAVALTILVCLIWDWISKPAPHRQEYFPVNSYIIRIE